MNTENEFKTQYYTDSNGVIRREIPKIRQSKKERIRKRWEGKEDQRFKNTGRGHKSEDHQLVKDYLRGIHPRTARKIQIVHATGLDQDRVLIILNNLSGLENTYEDGIKNDSKFSFLVYEDNETEFTEYGIARDTERAIL